MIILYCLLTTLNTNQIPLNKQLKTTQFWDREVRLVFSSPCQRQCELLPSLGVCRPLTFHILIFSSETPQMI